MSIMSERLNEDCKGLRRCQSIDGEHDTREPKLKCYPLPL
jgi:hypothetical protein